MLKHLLVSSFCVKNGTVQGAKMEGLDWDNMQSYYWQYVIMTHVEKIPDNGICHQEYMLVGL